MTERDSLELLINIQTKGQEILAQLAKTTAQVEDAEKRATSAGKEFENQNKRTTDSMGNAVLKAQLMAEGIMKVAGAVKTYSVEAAQYAARTEQVAAVMDNLARVNGMNVQSVRQVADGIKELGITTQESRNVINMMIGSQLDLSKSLEMTRMAQNAAKVAGISSSEALQRMISGIVSGEVEVLKHLGIQVSFEQAYIRAAKAMGVQTSALTEQQKVQIRADAVLARSPLIDGSYVMSLTTAAGQMQSLQRYTDELKNAFGQGLQPAIFDIVTGMERLSKYAQENVDGFQSMATTLTALGVAGATFAALAPFTGPMVAGGVAVAAGVTTKVLTDQDPIQANVDKYQGAFQKLEAQRKTMEHQLELGLVDEKAFKRFSDQLPAFRQLLKARFLEETAEIYKQRRRDFKPAPEPTLMEREMGAKTLGNQRTQAGVDTWESYTFGGMQVSRADMEAVINGKPVPFDKSGLIAKNPLMNTPKTGDGGAAAKALQQRQDSMERLLDGLGERGLDPFARLLADTQKKLRDFVQKYGALSGSDDSIDSEGFFNAGSGETVKAGRSLRDAMLREISKRQVETVQSDQSETGFQFGWQKSTAQSVDVDPARNESVIAQARERSVRGIQRYVQFQEQMVRLTAGPGGEAAAISTITDLRLDAAQKEFDITKDRVKFEETADQIRKDRLVQIAAMQHAELERYRAAAGSIYDAMVQKGMTGIGDFVKGQLQVVGRTVFQNIAVEVFKTAKDSLKLGDMIGGQVGKDGKLTGLGRVLQGTPLGVDQSKLVMEMNTSETRLNTVALKENTAVQRAGGAGGTGSTAGMADAVGSIVDKGGSKLASRFQRLLGSALTIGAGAYGIAQGIQQGGAKGTLNSAAGVASMASGLIGSKLFGAGLAAGPWGAIAAGAGIGLSLLAGMFGQSKEKFDKDQTDTLNRNRYESPVASNRVMDISGSAVDYDFTGRLRAATEKTTVIQFNVQAMDVKSFLERSGDIAEALHKELRLGHRVGLDIQQAILGT